ASIDYNQPAGTDAIPAKLRTGDLPDTYDLISALYRVRAMALVDGSSYFISARSEGETYQGQLKVIGRETIKTNVGSFSAIAPRRPVYRSESASNATIKFISDRERNRWARSR